MTYNRPGQGTHLVNTTGAPIAHNAPVSIGGFVGIAVKQKNDHWYDGFVANGPTPQNTIGLNEKFWCILHGIVQTDMVSGFAKGDPVYVTSAGVLTETTTGNAKFGRVVEVVGDGRGVPPNKVRINLDAKDSF